MVLSDSSPFRILKSDFFLVVPPCTRGSSLRLENTVACGRACVQPNSEILPYDETYSRGGSRTLAHAFKNVALFYVTKQWCGEV